MYVQLVLSQHMLCGMLDFTASCGVLYARLAKSSNGS